MNRRKLRKPSVWFVAPGLNLFGFSVRRALWQHSVLSIHPPVHSLVHSILPSFSMYFFICSSSSPFSSCPYLYTLSFKGILPPSPLSKIVVTHLLHELHCSPTARLRPPVLADMLLHSVTRYDTVIIISTWKHVRPTCFCQFLHHK
jgi:hypothetical protein